MTRSDPQVNGILHDFSTGTPKPTSFFTQEPKLTQLPLQSPSKFHPW